MDENQTTYGLDNSERLLNLCKEVFGDRMHEYYLGAPNRMIPESAMPCVIVQKTRGTVRVSATGTDDIQDQVNIYIYMNEKDDFKPGSKTDLTMRKMQNWIEGMNDEGTGYHENTLMHRLRSRITLQQYNIKQEVDIDYEFIPRIDEDGTDLGTLTQGLVQVIMTRKVLVLDRE